MWLDFLGRVLVTALRRLSLGPLVVVLHHHRLDLCHRVQFVVWLDFLARRLRSQNSLLRPRNRLPRLCLTVLPHRALRLVLLPDRTR